MKDTGKPIVTIVGGGSTAHALVPFLSGSGHLVNLLTRRPKEWSKDVVLQQHSIHGEIQKTFCGSLTRVSDLPGDVIPQAEVIVLCMPVSKYRLALGNIAPFIDRKRRVFMGAIYGQGGFNWMVEDIKRRCELSNLVYFAVGLVPWICRTIEYGRIGVTYGPKHANVAAVSPPDCFDDLNSVFLRDICEYWYEKGKFHHAHSFISLTLSVDNQIIHPTRCYGLFLKYGGKWKCKEHIPYFYRDYDQVSADILRQLDSDYSLIRETIKAKYPQMDFRYMLDYLALERFSYNSVNTDIRQSFVTSKTLGSIKPPVRQTAGGEWVIDRESRFFTDDIHYGMCIAKWIAQKMELDVPSIDKIIFWAQGVRNEEILGNDKRLIEPAVAVTKCMLGTPAVYGYESIDEIIG